MLTFYEWKSRGSVTQLLGQAILILTFVAWGLRIEHIFMTFFVCVSLPVFFAKPQQILYKNRIQNPKRSAKLYNIPNTTLRDRLSGRVHIDTLLLQIETVLFSQILYFKKVECC